MQGTLVNPDGEPMAGAEVRAFPVQAVGLPDEETPASAYAVTDQGGHYHLDGMEAGVFNVFARQSQGNKGLMIPEVRYEAIPLDLGVDTLVSSGSIAGRVFVGDSPAEEVFCYIPGSAIAAITGADGRFTLPNIPPGTYTLKYVGYELEGFTESGIIVMSDSLTVLESVNLFYDSRLVPAQPTGLAATLLDSTYVVVGLTWDEPASIDVEGYRVFARIYSETDSSETVAEYEAIVDSTTTAYADSLWMVFGGYGKLHGMDSAMVEYYLVALDSQRNESPRSTNPVRIRVKNQPWLKSEIQLHEIGGTADTLSCRDTLVLVTDWDNPVLDSAWYNIRVESFAAGNRIYGYKSDTTRHLAIEGLSDTLTWWDGQGYVAGDSVGGLPDSLEVRAQVAAFFGKKRDVNEMILEFRRDLQGCYRQIGEPRRFNQGPMP